MPFTEFYCIPVSGSNTNAGSTTAPPVLVCSGGAWNSGTGILGGTVGCNYYSCSGTQDLSMITTGMFAAISTGSINSARILGIVTGIDQTNERVFLHSTKLRGAIQQMSGANVRLAVGGPWEGPSQNLTGGFPFNMISGGMKNLSGDCVRLNMQNSTQYNITNYTTNIRSVLGPVVIQGYSIAPGDGGRAVFAGSGTQLFNLNAVNCFSFIDCIFKTDPNCTTGTVALFLVNSSSNSTFFYRCLFTNAGGDIISSFINPYFIECEFSDWGKRAGGIAKYAFNGAGAFPILFDRCYFHDATGVPFTRTIASLGPTTIKDSIFTRLGGTVINCAGTQGSWLLDSNDFYKIDSDIIAAGNAGATAGGMMYVKNCNFAEISGRIFNDRTASNVFTTFIQNCTYTSGNIATSGIYNDTLSGVAEYNIILYPPGQFPWNNPTVGDFRIVHPLSLGTARQIFNTSTGVVTSGFSDIGSTQHTGFPRGIIR